MSIKTAPKKLIAPIAKYIREHNDFVIVGHSRPDGDCIGSCLGLMHMLRAMGKKAFFYTPGPVPDNLKFLPGANEIKLVLPKRLPASMIVVDCSDEARVSDEFRVSGYVCNIDHHKSNSFFGDLNWVDVEAGAAAEQIYQLIDALGVKMTPDIAQCLYTGIFTDSGGFRFANTDAALLEAAAHCVKCGASAAMIAEEIYATVPLESIRLTAKVLSHLNFEYGGKFVWSELRRADYVAAGGEAFEPEERYEYPDGTDSIFNEDFFGDHRPQSTIPGPFVSAEALKKTVW